MRYVTLWMLILTVAVAAESKKTAAADQTLAEDKIRVLVVTGGHDFEEDSFYALFDAISDVTYTKAAFPAAAELLTPDLANHFDVIVVFIHLRFTKGDGWF